MNSIQEIYSLIKFLQIKPYLDLQKFNRDFGVLVAKKVGRLSEDQRSRLMQKFRILLKGIMLRRMKDSKIDGKPILNLPSKTEESINVTFSEDEQSFYTQLETNSRIQFNKYVRAGTVSKNYSNILVLLLRLRQACCHPHLNIDFESAGGDLDGAEMAKLAKGLESSVVSRLKEIEAFECPICYDAATNPLLALPCGHDTCDGCFQQLTENSAQNNLQHGNEGGGAAKCPQCRGPIDPKKVINYHTFLKVHWPEKATELGLVEQQEPVDEDAEDTMTESDYDTDDDATLSEADNEDDADEYGDLRDFVVHGDEDDDTEGFSDNNDDKEREREAKVEIKADEDDDNDDDNDDDFDSILDRRMAKRNPLKSRSGEPKDIKAPKKARGKAKATAKGKGKAKTKCKQKMAKVEPHELKTLRQEAAKNQESRRRYMHYLRKNWEPSSKVSQACEILQNIQETGEKTIVFSVWTGLLDLLEIPVKHELKLKYCRYDGSMSATQRANAAGAFMTDDRMKVMLVSLKAGNAGLNLTAASQVIIMDPFWNPYIEMQAVDRAHRIGQQRPVKVHRILVAGTVEDRIVKLQEDKRALVNAALDEGEAKNIGRLDQRQLAFLFNAQ